MRSPNGKDSTMTARIGWISFLVLCGALAAADGPCDWQGEEFDIDPTRRDLAGLDLLVAVPGRDEWPRIGREAFIGTGRHEDGSATLSPRVSRTASPIYFGAVKIAGAAQPRVTDSLRTWARSWVSLTYEPGRDILDDVSEGEAVLDIHVSRLSPAARIRAAGDVVLFHGMGIAGGKLTAPGRKRHSGSALPAWFATRAGEGIVIAGREHIAELPLDHLDRGWLLCWYGQSAFFVGSTCPTDRWGWGTEPWWTERLYSADSPLLLLFSEAPCELAAQELEGLRVSFAGRPAGILVVPVLGELLPRAADTEAWKKGLPEEMARRCDWWAEHVDRLPTDVRESYAYAPADDTVTLTETFTFERFRDGAGRAAPVPPGIATAYRTGLTLVSFPEPPYDPGVFTSVGDWLAVPDADSCEIRFQGLSKYVAPRPAPAGKAAPEALAVILEREVEKILEAGHLAPWIRNDKNCYDWGYTSTHIHSLPGETLYLLVEALPFLPPNLRARTIEYLKRERVEYPPESLAMLPTSQGARREWYPLSADFIKDEPANSADHINANLRTTGDYFVKGRKMIAPITPYYLAAYTQAVGPEGLDAAWPRIKLIPEPYLLYLDWAAGFHQWPDRHPLTARNGNTVRRCYGYYGTGGVIDANNHFAGAIGLIRLARTMKDSETETLAWGYLARMAALRHTGAKIVGRCHELRLLAPADGEGNALEDARMPYAMDEYGMTLYRAVSFTHHATLMPLRDAVPEMGLFARDFFQDEVLANFNGFTYWMPNWYLAFTESTPEGENGFAIPQDPYQLFLGHAWVGQATGPWLEAHLDVPWCERGDLYYLHKVVETIRAYMR